MKVKGWITVTTVVAALVSLLYSCENKSIPVPATVVPANCDTLSLTYSSGSNTMKPIIDAQCGTGNDGCHSPRTSYDFTTYAGIDIYYKNGTLYSCLVNGSPYVMPKTPQPGWSDSSACMLGKFKAWMNAGAPQ